MLDRHWQYSSVSEHVVCMQWSCCVQKILFHSDAFKPLLPIIFLSSLPLWCLSLVGNGDIVIPFMTEQPPDTYLYLEFLH